MLLSCTLSDTLATVARLVIVTTKTIIFYNKNFYSTQFSDVAQAVCKLCDFLKCPPKNV